MSDDVTWQLSGTQAHLRCGESLTASLDALSPARGLFEVRSGSRLHTGCDFLGVGVDVAAPDTLAEFYHRGGDLIARYRQTAQRAFAVEVYWRAGFADLERGRFLYCDLLVSVETQLLDSRPLVVAHTSLSLPEHKDVIRGRDYCVARLADSAWTYIELCHPDDSIEQDLPPAQDGVHIATRLFGQPLEKGVILRSRLRGLFVPGADDESLARAALADFASLPPPLTT